MAKNKNNANNVTTTKLKVAGAVWWAALSESPTVPTDASTALDEKFKCLGHVGKDGISNEVETKTTEIENMNGDVVLTVRTSRSEKYSYPLIEALNPEVLKHVYGEDNVTGTSAATGITVKHTSADLPHGVFVVETVHTGGIIRRIVVPNGQVVKVDSVELKGAEEITYKTTLSCTPDATDVTVYEYLANAA